MSYSVKPSLDAIPTDILAYRYKGELVYVPMAMTYVEALSHARDAFPPLKRLGDASLSLSLSSTPGRERKFVRISALAWPKLIVHMPRYQIIDVHNTPETCNVPVSIPEITAVYADPTGAEKMEPVPPYQGPDVVGDEKFSLMRPRTLSMPMLKRNGIGSFRRFSDKIKECIQDLLS